MSESERERARERANERESERSEGKGREVQGQSSGGREKDLRAPRIGNMNWNQINSINYHYLN